MNIMKMMKEMSKIQDNMKKAQEKLENIEVEGSAGAGMVTVIMNGKMKPTSLKISPEAMEDKDATLLEDLILAALEDARVKAKSAMQEEMQSATGGLNLPAGMDGLLGG